MVHLVPSLILRYIVFFSFLQHILLTLGDVGRFLWHIFEVAWGRLSDVVFSRILAREDLLTPIAF